MFDPSIASSVVTDFIGIVRHYIVVAWACAGVRKKNILPLDLTAFKKNAAAVSIKKRIVFIYGK